MTFTQLLQYAAPYRKNLVASGFLMLADTAIVLSIPWLGGQVAQRVADDGAKASSGIFLGLFGLLAVQGGLKFGSSYLAGSTSASIFADLRVRVYDHLQSLPISFFDKERQGAMLTLISYEASQLASYIAGTLVAVLPTLVTVAGAVVLMFRIDPLLAALLALLVPVFYLALKVMGRRLRPLALQMREAEATVAAMAHENLHMLPAIKAFTGEREASTRYVRQIAVSRDLSARQLRAFGTLEPVIQFLASAGAVGLLWLISDRVGGGQMRAGELVSFLLYAALLTRPVAGLAGVYGETQMVRTTLQRLDLILGEPPEATGIPALPMNIVRGHVEFRDVHFSYPGRPPALKGVNLRIAAGETVAITGPNGAGKSTLTHLLLRLHMPASGQVLIDDIDIAAVELRSLRLQIGLVPQHVLLFNGSVSENIRFGRPNASESDIEGAARAAQAHEFIGQLPDGYQTPIGDQGVRLSGGQRQRIALARALLKDPPILVLDEPTAMFDPEGEVSLVQACRHLFAQRTVILITHRPASLALADRVVHLHQGSFTDVHGPQPAPAAGADAPARHPFH